MLRELVQALVERADLRGEFRRDPARVLQRFEVTAAEQKVLLEQDEAGLVAALGAELLSAYRVIDRRPGLGYPGAPKLEVTSVKTTRGLNPSLDIAITWNHEGVPTVGLPVWVLVDIRDHAGAQVAKDFVVPRQLDFDASSAAITAYLPLKPGRYSLALRVTHPDVQDSDPFEFTF